MLNSFLEETELSIQEATIDGCRLQVLSPVHQQLPPARTGNRLLRGLTVRREEEWLQQGRRATDCEVLSRLIDPKKIISRLSARKIRRQDQE